MERRRLKIKKKKSLIAGSSLPSRMKLQLWSHFQLRRVHFGATSWSLFAQTFSTPAGPPRGDAFSGAQLLRAVLSAIALARGSLHGRNPGPLPSTSAWTLFLSRPLLSQPPRTPHPAGPPRSPRINKCAPCARGSSGRSRLSLSQCHVLTFWVLAPKISSRTAVPFPPLPLFLSPFPFPFSACDQ